MTLGLPYKDAQAHMKTCDFRRHHCPLKCGVKLFGHEKEEHMKICKNFSVTCPECNMVSYPNRDDEKNKGPHDCFEALV